MKFPLLKENIETLSELKNGTSNKTFLLNGKYVYRKKLVTDVIFYSPCNEAKVLKAINEKDVAPKQFAYDENSGDKVEEFISGARYFDSSKEDLKLLAKLLKKLHSCPIEGIYSFNAKERYLAYKEKSQEDLEEGEIYDEVAHLFNGKEVLAHNDLWSGNILIKNNKAYLIVFEFAATNCPIFDLASLLSENKIRDKELTLSFLKEYYGKDDVEQEYIDVSKMEKFEDALWFYWAKCRYLDTKDDNFLRIMEDKRQAFLERKIG